VPPPADLPEDRSQEGRKHLFVIDGAPEFLDLMREIFQDARYNVTTTNFVPNSFDQIAAAQPDALIVDIVLGQQAGWALLERLHADAATSGIPILIVSTNRRLLEEAQEQAARFGTHHYLVKPFDLDELLACIEEMIGPAQLGEGCLDAHP
jgi:chemosensory pili system protein ChpA (sensor histidine kinase/response regulator)